MHVDPRAFDAISDAVDEGLYNVHHLCVAAEPFSDVSVAVNKLKGVKSDGSEWDGQSQFDAEKDKTQFRQYEEACERVKNFYREQHGRCHSTVSHSSPLTHHPGCREADGRVQHQGSPGLQEDRACTDGYVRASWPDSAVIKDIAVL